MAQYNISVSGNQLIIELIVTGGDFAPSIVSIKNPSIKLTTDRIKFFDSGVYNMALFFNQINEIDGVAPTDLEDAADKIIALIANFNGGGAAPYKVYTALLSQSGTDAPVATVLENTLGGDVVWSYESVGVYHATLAGAFLDDNKVAIMGINGSTAITSNSKHNFGYVNDEDSVEIVTTDINTNAYTDTGFYGQTVEIRVYN